MSKSNDCDGYPSTGVHDISTSNLWVGADPYSPTVTNIVVNNQLTPFYFKYLGSYPGCVYEINLGSGPNKQWVTHDGQWVNINGTYSQWILNKVSDNVYTVTLNDGNNLCWTDMGPNSEPHRQLQLHSYQSGNTSQQFRII